MNSIQQLFREHGPAYYARFGSRMPHNHKKVIQAICNCGNGAFGQHGFACDGCGKYHTVIVPAATATARPVRPESPMNG